MARYPDNVDLKLIRAIGQNMPAIVRGESAIMDHVMQQNMLDQVYSEGLGFAQYNIVLGRLTKQITHRYPHLKIIETGKNTWKMT